MKLDTIGIVGAGQMGIGIAQVCAAAGFGVMLNDVEKNAVTRGMERLSASYDRLVSRGKMAEGEASDAMARVKAAFELGELAACDVLIEAATENVRIKQQILRDLDVIAKPEAIVATNTSSVSITKLAATLANPSRFVGMHFFNPVPAMALVEVIRGMQTGDATFDAAAALAGQLGKSAIQVKNTPGFVVNRILVPMINEAVFVLHEGCASAEEIDAGMRLGANHPMGPLALADLIGLDTVLSIMEVIYRELNDTKYRPAPLLREMVDAGYLGRKTKRGFYSY